MLWQMLLRFPQKGQTDNGEWEDETFCIHHRFQSLFSILIFISEAYGLLGKGRKSSWAIIFSKSFYPQHNAYQSFSHRIQKSLRCWKSNWELIKNSYFCKTLSLSHSVVIATPEVGAFGEGTRNARRCVKKGKFKRECFLCC